MNSRGSLITKRREGSSSGERSNYYGGRGLEGSLSSSGVSRSHSPSTVPCSLFLSLTMPPSLCTRAVVPSIQLLLARSVSHSRYKTVVRVSSRMSGNLEICKTRALRVLSICMSLLRNRCLDGFRRKPRGAWSVLSEKTASHFLLFFLFFQHPLKAFPIPRTLPSFFCSKKLHRNE